MSRFSWRSSSGRWSISMNFCEPRIRRCQAPLLPRLNSVRNVRWRCGITMYGGALTRYDGWFSAAIFGLILVGLFVAWYRRTADSRLRRSMTKSFAEVLLLNALVPVYWLVYTWAVSGNALDFINGPYSAQAIALRSTAHGAPPYPGQHDVFTAAFYFLKSAQLNMGSPVWGGLLFALALLGAGVAASPPALRSPAAALAAVCVLLALDCLWQRAHLHSGLVSLFVLQRPLRNGTATGLRGLSGDRCDGSPG